MRRICRACFDNPAVPDDLAHVLRGRLAMAFHRWWAH